jgi:TolB protein
MPAMSPDGRFVAYAAQGHTDLVQSDGHGQRDLGAGGCATWSPDGTRIAVCTAAGSIEIIDLADGQRILVPTGPGSNEPTVWSPDGTSIAFVSDRDGNAEVYIVDSDGSNERRLTTAPGDQAAFAWTPRGLLITSSAPEAIVSDWFLVDPVSGSTTVVRWLRGTPDPIGYVP